MIAIDTIILVRYLVRDEPVQAERARRLLQEELTADVPGFVSIATIVELGWVLQRVYKVRLDDIRMIVAGLLEAPQIVIDQRAVVEAALASDHPDLADTIAHETGKANNCARTLTFDRKFARLAGVDLLAG